jgi:hypothetical protein
VPEDRDARSNPVRASSSCAIVCPIPPSRGRPNSSLGDSGISSVPGYRLCTLRDDDDGEVPAGPGAVPQMARDPIDVEGDLGDQDRVRSPAIPA